MPPQQVRNLRLVDGQYLSWDEPYDNIGIHGYEIFEDGISVGTSPGPMFAWPSVDAAREYRVQAFDASGNVGIPSVPLGQALAEWNGDDPTAGVPGDGVRWGDPRNWTRDGVEDAGVPFGNRVVFLQGSSQSTIDLGANRWATSLEFQASYTLNSRTLTVATGDITVQDAVLAIINSNLQTPAPRWRKLGGGTLRFNQTAATDVLVVEGTYGGTATHSRGMEVLPQAAIRPGNPTGTMVVSRDVVMHSEARLEIVIPPNGQAPRILTFGDFVVEPGAILEAAPGDYNGDGVLDCADIDLLQLEILNGSNNLAFDLNGDGVVDVRDFDNWYAMPRARFWEMRT